MRRIEIVGQVFGRLTVQRKAPGPCMWECFCTCGTVRLATGTNLRSGNTTSCGCHHKEVLTAKNSMLKTLPPWAADMALYQRKLGYRKQRNALGSNQFSAREGRSRQPVEWALTLDEYVTLVTGECFYCGVPPSQRPHGINMGVLKRNGIDRVNNDEGYTLDNCVSCCSPCNREKRAQSQRVFIENTRRRYEHLRSKGLITT